jgi:glycosyltransferase involved in cell wall biosynthesis
VLDAILVPIAHDTAELKKAIGFAARLGCVLVAFCSHEASAAEAVRLAEGRGVELVAIDIDGMPADLLPAFATTDVLREAGFSYPKDTSAKRNLGLVVARFAGWERVVFLDDDIHLPDPADLERAALLLDRYEAVGLEIGDFPDNSVVCHAHRQTRGEQTTFIGGGALAVGTEAMSSFFPQIYNEDWFFLLDGDRLRPSTIVGAVEQTRYDPFQTDERARIEEFGDSLAEGVFWLLDQGEGPAGATEGFWREFLDHRWRFIGEIIGRIERIGIPPERAGPMRAALEAARRESERITPSLCVDFLTAWQDDRERWRSHLQTVYLDRAPGLNRYAGGTRVEKVLSELGLMECADYLRGGGE